MLQLLQNGGELAAKLRDFVLFVVSDEKLQFREGFVVRVPLLRDFRDLVDDLLFAEVHCRGWVLLARVVRMI